MHNNLVRFVIIGFGHIGKAHLAALQALDNAKVVAIVDINPISGVEYPCFESVETLLDSLIVFDVAVIAVPNGLHLVVAEKCIAAGKHILIEKPFGLNKQSCIDILQIAKTKNIKLMVVNQLRFSKTMVFVKQAIDQELLGEVQQVLVNGIWNRGEDYYKNSTWRGKTALDGGTLFTQFSHFVDALIWMFGKLKPTQARISNFAHQQLIEFEDSGTILFGFGNKGMGYFHYTTACPIKNFESNITIIGSKGLVKISGQYLNKLDTILSDSVVLPSNFEDIEPLHRQVYRNFIDVILYNKLPYASAESAVETVDFIANVYNLAEWN